jgi:hypothetical protein
MNHINSLYIKNADLVVSKILVLVHVVIAVVSRVKL